MMNQIIPNLTPFPSGWFSSGGLGPLRPCDATYCRVPYEDLPPLSEALFQGTLHWLLPLDQDFQREQQNKYYSPSWAFSSAQWKQMLTTAHELRMFFPEAFQQLMNAPELQDRILSCTNCYFQLSEKLIPCPGKEEDSLLRFFNAGQGQLAWYLYLTAQGEHCVLVGYPDLDLWDDPDNLAYDITEEERQMILEGKGLWVCASSFEEFLYRFWIENLLWYKLVWYKGQKPLTAEEKRYISFYQTQPDRVAWEVEKEKPAGIRFIRRFDRGFDGQTQA